MTHQVTLLTLVSTAGDTILLLKLAVTRSWSALLHLTVAEGRADAHMCCRCVSQPLAGGGNLHPQTGADGSVVLTVGRGLFARPLSSAGRLQPAGRRLELPTAARHGQDYLGAQGGSLEAIAGPDAFAKRLWLILSSHTP